MVEVVDCRLEDLFEVGVRFDILDEALVEEAAVDRVDPVDVVDLKLSLLDRMLGFIAFPGGTLAILDEDARRER